LHIIKKDNAILLETVIMIDMDNGKKWWRRRRRRQCISSMI
jgi:hypothetical protein